MERKVLTVLGDEEEELIEALEKSGLKNSEAKILVTLSKADKGGMIYREIERMSMVKSSTVNIVINDLARRGYVAIHEGGHMEQGHSMRTMRLAHGVDGIVAIRAKEMTVEEERSDKNFTEIKKMAKTLKRRA